MVSLTKIGRMKKKKKTGSRTGLRRTEAHMLDSMVCPGASFIRLVKSLAMIGLEDGCTRLRRLIQHPLAVAGSVNSP